MGGGHPPPRILIIYKNNYERMITNMQNELLDLIDQIEMQQAIAEMEVCNALLNSYSKSCMILENASDTADLSSYSIFQESAEIYQEGEKWDKVKSAGSQALKDAKGKESESLIIRILKFIPRLIASFIRNLRANKKQMEKKIDVIEKSAEEIVEAVEKGIDEDAAKNKKSAESPDTSKFAMKDGGKQLDDKAVRDLRKRTVAKQKTMALPMKDNWSCDLYYVMYADGDIRVKFPWDVFNLVSKLNKETIDFAAILVPTEDALEMLVDTFSDNRIGSNGKPDHDQFMNRSAVVDLVRTRDLPGVVVRIQNKIDEADKYLKKLDQFFAANNKEIEDKDVRDVMLSKVIRAYRNATAWMGYTEKLLSVTGKRIERTVKNLPTFKSGSAHDDTIFGRDKDATTYLKPEDQKKITACVNQLQRIITGTNFSFNNIMKRCDDGLDKVYAAIQFTANRAGIQLTALADREGLRNFNKSSTIPHQRSHGVAFKGDSATGNADRQYKRLIY